MCLTISSVTCVISIIYLFVALLCTFEKVFLITEVCNFNETELIHLLYCLVGLLSHVYRIIPHPKVMFSCIIFFLKYYSFSFHI